MSAEERKRSSRSKERTSEARVEMERRRAIVQRLLVEGVYKLDELREILQSEYGIEATRSDISSDRAVALRQIAAENGAVISDFRAIWFARLEAISRIMMKQLYGGRTANDQRRAAEVLLQVFGRLNDVIGVEGALSAELNATPELVERMVALLKMLRERNMSPSEAFEAMINTLASDG